MRKVVYFTALVIYFIVFISLTSCEDSSEVSDVSKTHDWTEEPIQLVVYVYPNQKQVTISYEDYINRNDLEFDGIQRYGWAGWNDKGYCEVHSLDLKNENDKKAMTTLGHEVFHCLYGTWHKE